MEGSKEKAKKTIVLVGTLDTKGEELGFVRDYVEQQGCRTMVVDAGVRGEPLFKPDIPREQVAKAGGAQVSDLAALTDEGKAIAPMIEGVAKVVQELHRLGKLDGIFSLGGSMGTAIGTSAMRALPHGVPKVMVSTIMMMNPRPYLGTSDIVIYPSLTDIFGLNQISWRMLRTAAGAIVGMVKADCDSPPSGKPLVGVAILGSLMDCARVVKPALEEKGYEVLVFHAVGTGGQTLERWIDEGLIKGVLDLSLQEVVGNLFGGTCDAGPSRLEAAGRKGIPQLVSLGDTDRIGFIPPESVPKKLRQRKISLHNPQAAQVRISKKEAAILGKTVAQKLNQSRGPIVVVAPQRGFSSWDMEGRPFYDPDTDRVLINTLRRNLKPDIRLVEVDAHINDSSFALKAVELFQELSGKPAKEDITAGHIIHKG